VNVELARSSVPNCISDNPVGKPGSCVLLVLYTLVSMWGERGRVWKDKGQRERTQPGHGLKGG
jgi:hypothetical protein